jgi:thioredoxin 1
VKDLELGGLIYDTGRALRYFRRWDGSYQQGLRVRVHPSLAAELRKLPIRVNDDPYAIRDSLWGVPLDISEDAKPRDHGDRLDDRKGRTAVKILYFTADWCQPCYKFGPIVDKVGAEVGIEVQRVDVDEQPSIALDFGVQSVPTLFLMDGNEALNSIIGATTRTMLLKWLGPYVGSML